MQRLILIRCSFNIYLMKFIKKFEKFINDHEEEREWHRIQAHVTDMKSDVMADINNDTDSGCELPVEMNPTDRINDKDIDGSKSKSMDEIRQKNFFRPLH